MQLFGFEVNRVKEEDKSYKSFVEPSNDEGALNVGTALGGSYGMLLDMEGSAKSEAELVTRYRRMALNPEIQTAVDEIVNEAISVDSNEKVVELNLDDIEKSDKLKTRIHEEFDYLLNLLDFSNNAYDIFSKFYIDGRLNYHIMIDEEELKNGIVELRYIDPRKIRLVREYDDRKKDSQTGNTLKKIKKEYYVYSDTGFGASGMDNNSQSTDVTGIRIAKDSIARVTSGLLNESNTLVLSHLHKAIKPLNQLRMLEDAVVVYTLTRAPERRIFYIDVGNLPKAKAEQYLYDMMSRHKNKMTYDASTGELENNRKMMTMTEDFWFPRREGSRGTEIDTLPSGTGLMENENLEYFQRKLYKSLHVPVSRLEPEGMHSFGRVSEITRDELKFSKFIRRMRSRFSILFDHCLEKQLILKGVISPDEWKEIRNNIRYDFMKDNYFEELKESEITRERMNTLREVNDHVGIYYSREWVVKNILQMTEQEWEEEQEKIKNEKAAGILPPDDAPSGSPF